MAERILITSGAGVIGSHPADGLGCPTVIEAVGTQWVLDLTGELTAIA